MGICGVGQFVSGGWGKRARGIYVRTIERIPPPAPARACAMLSLCWMAVEGGGAGAGTGGAGFWSC